MISRILSVIPPGNRKYPLRYRRALSAIYNRLDYLKFKFLQGGEMPETPLTQLLRALSTCVSYETLAACTDDLERYMSEIKFAKNSKLHSFDPAVSGKILKGSLIKTLNSYAGVPEVILNVESESPLKDLPFDKGWDEWQEMRGIRILYTDSFELVDDMSNGFVNFKQQGPNIAIIAIDPSVLLFKMFKYKEYCAENGITPNDNLFFKRYEYARFFEDIFDSWLLNFISVSVTADNLSAAQLVKEVVIPKTIAGTNRVLELAEGLREYTEYLKTKKIKLQDFIDTPWFLNSTIREKVAELKKWSTLPPGRAYTLLDAIRWAPYTMLITDYLRICPDTALATALSERCRQVWVEQFKYAQAANAAHGQVYRNFLSAVDEDIQESLKRAACQG